MDKISLLIPTRGRAAQFKRAIASFIETAEKPEELEIVVGIEMEDRDTIVAFNVTLYFDYF